MEKYELIDHTADIGVKAFGNNLSECFENVAKAMFDIITDSSKVENIGQYNVELQADDTEQLLIDWLSELLYLNSAKNLVFGFFKVNLGDNNKKLNATIFGEKYDISRHKVGAEIKAVTYHMLEIRKKKPYHAQVLFDI